MIGVSIAWECGSIAWNFVVGWFVWVAPRSRISVNQCCDLKQGSDEGIRCERWLRCSFVSRTKIEDGFKRDGVERYVGRSGGVSFSNGARVPSHASAWSNAAKFRGQILLRSEATSLPMNFLLVVTNRIHDCSGLCNVRVWRGRCGDWAFLSVVAICVGVVTHFGATNQSGGTQTCANWVMSPGMAMLPI